MFTDKNVRGRKTDALRTYLLAEGATAFAFAVVQTLYIVYYTVSVGLNPFQIILMGTIFETTIFLFEIPTGIIADVYSRRLSILLGLCLTGTGFLVAGAFPTAAAILLSEVITGIGATCLSGATQAWITDEIGIERANRALVRASQIQLVTGMAGSVVSVILASMALNLPFLVAGVFLLLLTGLLLMTMPETGFHHLTASERHSWGVFFGKLRGGARLIKRQHVLIPFLLITFVIAFHSEGFDHLWQLHFLKDLTLPGVGNFSPVIWFGVISIIANVFSIGLTEIVRRRVNLSDPSATVRALMVMYSGSALAILVFSLSGQFALAMLAYWLIAALRSAENPVSAAWLNQHIPSEIRATMLSLNSQTGAFGEIIGGPPIGAISATSIRGALAACGIILSLTIPMLAFTLRRQPEAAALVVEQVG